MLPELAKWQEEYLPWLWAAASHELESQNKRETEEATWAPSFHLLPGWPQANSLLWAPCWTEPSDSLSWNKQRLSVSGIFISVTTRNECRSGDVAQSGRTLALWAWQPVFKHPTPIHKAMYGCMGPQLQHCRDRWTLSAHCLPGQNSKVLVKRDTVSRQ